MFPIFSPSAKSKYHHNNLVELGPSLSGFLDKFASFPRLVCPMSSTLFYGRDKSKHYPGIEPSTFGVAVGYANHYTIQAAFFSPSLHLERRKFEYKLRTIPHSGT
jgi:hypothetical protein